MNHISTIDIMEQSGLDKFEGRIFGSKKAEPTNVGRLNQPLDFNNTHLVLHKGKKPIASPRNQHFLEKTLKQNDDTILSMNTSPTYIKVRNSTQSIRPRVVPLRVEKLEINFSLSPEEDLQREKKTNISNMRCESARLERNRDLIEMTLQRPTTRFNRTISRKGRLNSTI